jgi:hypothetical protein
LGFLHPDSLGYLEFEAPPPMDMACLLQWLDGNQQIETLKRGETP